MIAQRRCRGIAPIIPNRGGRWSWVVNVTPRLLYPPGERTENFLPRRVCTLIRPVRNDFLSRLQYFVGRFLLTFLCRMYKCYWEKCKRSYLFSKYVSRMSPCLHWHLRSKEFVTYFVMYTATHMYFLSSNVGVLERKGDFRFRLEWAESWNAIKLTTTHNCHGFSSTDGPNIVTSPWVLRLDFTSLIFARHQGFYRRELVREVTISNEANA